MDINHTGAKIIHWEYNNLLFGKITDLILEYKLNYVLKPGTDIRNGFFFKWIVKISSEKGLFLNCISEEIFVLSNVESFDYSDAHYSIQYAFENFNTAFMDKIKTTDLATTIDGIDYKVRETDVLRLLGLFQEK